jgi:hypothetical protein
MNVITDNPIIEDMSNCCGKSSADGIPFKGRMRRNRKITLMRDDFAGRPVIIQEKSGFDDYSNNDGSRPRFGGGDMGGSDSQRSALGSMVKDYLSTQRTARKEDRTKTAGDILLGASTRAETRRGAREARRGERLTQREARQSERIANRKARAARRNDRKAKRNAQKLVLIQRTRTSEPKFFFPLQKLRLSKRKKGMFTKTYPDGTEGEIAANQTVMDNAGNVFSSADVAKATNIPEQTLQGMTVSPTTGVQDPTSGQSFEIATTTNAQGQPTLGIEVNDANVSGAMDGQAYLASDIQGSSEPTQDVKTEDQKKAEGTGMSKTTKWVLGIGAVVVVGLVVYALVKNKKSPAGAASASSAGGATLSKVA